MRSERQKKEKNPPQISLKILGLKWFVTNNLYPPSLPEGSRGICRACWSACAAGCQCPSLTVPLFWECWSDLLEPIQCLFQHPTQK